MKVGNFQISAKENTKRDYIVPWGLGFSWLAIYWLFKYSYSWHPVGFEEETLAVLIMVLFTLFIPRFFRIFVFPFGVLALTRVLFTIGLIDLITAAMLSEVAIIYGFGYIIGNLAIYLDHRVSSLRIKSGIVGAFIGLFYGWNSPLMHHILVRGSTGDLISHILAAYVLGFGSQTDDKIYDMLISLNGTGGSSELFNMFLWGVALGLVAVILGWFLEKNIIHAEDKPDNPGKGGDRDSGGGKDNPGKGKGKKN